MLDKAKMLLKLKQVQKELKKIEVEAVAGDGAVRIVVNGEQKVVKVELDSQKLEANNKALLENWISSSLNQALSKAQAEAAKKMQSVGSLGDLSSLGL
jgi:DNA-binding YbaB/EbfC family protein